MEATTRRTSSATPRRTCSCRGGTLWTSAPTKPFRPSRAPRSSVQEMGTSPASYRQQRNIISTGPLASVSKPVSTPPTRPLGPGSNSTTAALSTLVNSSRSVFCGIQYLLDDSFSQATWAVLGRQERLQHYPVHDEDKSRLHPLYFDGIRKCCGGRSEVGKDKVGLLRWLQRKLLHQGGSLRHLTIEDV